MSHLLNFLVPRRPNLDRMDYYYQSTPWIKEVLAEFNPAFINNELIPQNFDTWFGNLPPDGRPTKEFFLYFGELVILRDASFGKPPLYTYLLPREINLLDNQMVNLNCPYYKGNYQKILPFTNFLNDPDLTVLVYHWYIDYGKDSISSHNMGFGECLINALDSNMPNLKDVFRGVFRNNLFQDVVKHRVTYQLYPPSTSTASFFNGEN